jgi:hypothetical protein
MQAHVAIKLQIPPGLHGAYTRNGGSPGCFSAEIVVDLHTGQHEHSTANDLTPSG